MEKLIAYYSLPTLLIVSIKTSTRMRQQAKQSKAKQSKAKMANHLTGYNLFMSEQIKKYKEVKSSTDRLKKVGADWKLLAQEEKDVWNAQAKALNPQPEPEEKKVTHLHGYNLYMRE